MSWFRARPFVLLPLVLAGCEMPESLRQIGVAQTAVAAEFGLDPEQVNVSSTTGAGGTELRFAFQAADLPKGDDVCERVVAAVTAADSVGTTADRISVVEVSRMGVGPVNATSQREVCAMKRNAETVDPAARASPGAETGDAPDTTPAR